MEDDRPVNCPVEGATGKIYHHVEDMLMNNRSVTAAQVVT